MTLRILTLKLLNELFQRNRRWLQNAFERSWFERLGLRHNHGSSLPPRNCSGRFGGLRQEGMAVESEPEVLEDWQAVFAEG